MAATLGIKFSAETTHSEYVMNILNIYIKLYRGFTKKKKGLFSERQLTSAKGTEHTE